MRVRSFAKINLGLEILRKRPDGFHDIRTLFQSVSLFDILEFLPSEKEGIHLEGSDPSIPWDEGNLVFRAAKLLRDQKPHLPGVSIKVEKKIPSGSGLGGGSSNAAMTLYGLNELWGLGLRRSDLAEMGRKLGSDVPYFLEGGLCFGQERGDRITPLADLPALPVVLVFADFPVSTTEIYRNVRPSSLTSGGKGSKMSQFFRENNFSLLENALEEAVFRFYPQLRETKHLLLSRGAILSLVTGTGSTVFGLFRDRDEAERAREEIGRKQAAVLVECLSRERYWAGAWAGV